MKRHISFISNYKELTKCLPFIGNTVTVIRIEARQKKKGAINNEIKIIEF